MSDEAEIRALEREIGRLEQDIDTALDGIATAKKIATDHAGIDGAHHKQWVIDRMLRALLGGNYDAWAKRNNWTDVGIPP